MKNTTKKRNPIYSAIFSIIVPGMGQIYNGQVKKALLFYITWLIADNIASVVFDLQYTFVGLITITALSFLIHIGSIFDSIIISSKLKNFSLKKFNKWYVYTSIVVITYSFIYLYDAESKMGIYSFHLPTNGMEPTVLVGDYVVADVKCYETNAPKQGDLMAFYYPLEPSVSYVKRCIASGGQIVEIKDRVIYVDSVKFSDSQYVQFLDANAEKRNKNDYIYMHLGSKDNFGPIKVPPNHYFVLGDNRDNSFDSRYWGFVPRENIYGKLLFIYFSWDENKNALLKKVRWSRIGMYF